MKNYKKFMQKKWVKRYLIPVALLGAWFLLTVWYIVFFDQSILVLSFNHKESNFTQITHNKLTKGEKLAGEFTADENNLGIVAMRFQSFQRVPYKDEDMLEFRLKEKGSKNWYYQNHYRSGFVYDLPFLPFGFPIIADSKGKTYDFELESIKGNQLNGVALSYREPVLASKYQEDKHSLLKNPKLLLNFAVKKFVNSFQTIDIIYSSIIFALPLLFYLFWISPAKTFLIDAPVAYLGKLNNSSSERGFGKYYKDLYALGRILLMHNLVVIIVLAILIDVLFLQILNDLLYFIVIILWIVLLRVYHLNSKISFMMGIALLLVPPVLLQFNIVNSADKAASWAFVFFVAGIIHTMFDIKKIETNKK